MLDSMVVIREGLCTAVDDDDDKWMNISMTLIGFLGRR